MTRRWLRWLPAVAVPAVIAAGVLAVPLQAGAAVDLPDKTPDELLAFVAQSDVRAMSGTIEQTSALGLPELDLGSAGGDSAEASVLELLTGTNEARIFVDGPDKVRVQVMDRLAERNVIRNGDDVWVYDSEDNSVVHATLPADVGGGDHEAYAGEIPTPAELSETFLSRIDASTEVTVGTDATVAGRSVYEMILTPRTDDTLVSSVSLAIDSETGLPLSFAVEAAGQDDPAFRVAFSEITIGAPDAALFDFTPPAGATVEEEQFPEHDAAAKDTTPRPEGAEAKFTAIGDGWSTVVELPAGDDPAGLADSPLLAQATTDVDGGRALSTALVTVLWTDDGRVLAGAVPLERLQAAASE